MPGRLVTSQSQFDSLCDRAREAGVVAFDTEFVSESYFRPRLCLIQLATTELEAVIDPFEIEDLSKWWELMRDPGVTVIVHGGREEIRFCMHLEADARRSWSMSRSPRACSAGDSPSVSRCSCHG